MASTDEDPLFKRIVSAIRAAAALSAQDIDFYRSLHPSVGQELDDTSATVVSLINELLLSVDENNNELKPGRDNFEDSWKELSNVMDNIFEKSDHAFDSIKHGSSSRNEGVNMQYLADSSHDDSTPSKRIEKPQLLFKTPVDNTELHPFKPLLKEKPHALKPLEESLMLAPEEENFPAHYPHPYEYEIDKQPYNDSVLEVRERIDPQPWEATEPIWVDNVESLSQMLDELKEVKELAVDLEHHDYRSYYGIVCLMQISSRSKDWLVDTIALRDDLHVLNVIFTDPTVVKVFHGAFMDMIWLQRDLGLYVVSLFDTYHASRALGFPKHSLAYLLETFAKFKTSKKYQLADWRVRPLPKPLRDYARSDTHFLLSIYDDLRNALVKAGKLAEVLNASRNVAKRRFEYTSFRPRIPDSNVYSPIESTEPWRKLMYQYNLPPSKEPLLKKLYEWRDTVARRDDESVRYVMPNQLLVSLVSLSPSETAGVLSVSTYVTDYVRSNARTLANLIKRTLETIKAGTASVAEFSSSERALSNPAATLSLHMIQNLDDHFRSLLMEAQKQSGSICSQHSSSLLFNSDLATGPSAVEYTNGQKHVIGDNVLQTRKHALLQKFTSQPVEPVTDIEAPSHQSSSENPQVSEDISPSEPQDSQNEVQKDEPDFEKSEIVVLRKKKKAHAQKPKGTSSSPTETVDYSNAKEVLGKGTSSTAKRGDKDRPRKRKFDPYGQDNNAPSGVKKKNKPSKGKSISFK
ncbi:FACL001Cp [Eremothecium gossypii FDAG1]|nr:FACL001Cp [Eremothecium gossypii FDAG1]